MPRFRKKPVVIEAVQWNGNRAEMVDFVKAAPLSPAVRYNTDGTLTIPTLEGDHTANAGDWVIRGVKGELSPCKPDIFAATYEPAD